MEEQINKIIKIKELLESKDKIIIQNVLREILKLDIIEIEYDKNIKLNDISEYEFELAKVKVKLSTEEEVEVYLKMVRKTRIKESIFCYWCSIYEEELMKIGAQTETIINKVLISELCKKRFHQRIFLEIENNRTQILETGTEVNFLEIINYINENKNKVNKYENLLKYFDENSEDVLMIGLKMKRDNNIE